MLKSVEIQGFKSFPDPTLIEFHDGITAVVGPNGAGKSNIADAIRWVLGEQSAKTLRGSRMEDVVFNGTAQRRPVSFAEVTLTLDNQSGILPIDYQTVSITRRYFRSGESVYMINKTPCRLKDITRLIMDTGIGVEGYSIVGQGRVNEILSGNADDRRAIFEEASGIGLYRTRKVESLRRLERSEQNLVRVNDILNELHEREVPLRKQAEDARRHLELRNRYRDIDVTLTLKQLEKYELEQAKGEDDETMLHLDLEEARKERDEIRLAHRAAIDRSSVLDEALEEVQAVIAAFSVEKTQLAGEDALLREKLESSKATSQRLLEEKNRLTIRLVAADQEMAERKKQKNTLDERKVSLEAAYRDACQAVDAVDADYVVLGQRLQESIRMRDSLNERIAASQALLQEKRGEKQALLERLQQLEREKKELDVDCVERRAGLGQRDEAIEQLRCGIERDEQRADKARALTESLQDEASIIDQNIASIKQAIEKLTYEAETLERLEETFEGYNRPVKLVMDEVNRRKRRHEVLGPLASLLAVPEELALAIETALGGAANDLVCDTRTTAERWIDWLRETRGGRATFLPLDALNPYALNRDILLLAEGAPGYLGVAADLVSCADSVVPALRMALGRTLVVKTLRDATSLSDRIRRGCRIVSLQGDVVHPSGSMTGGFMPTKPRGLLGRPERIAAKRVDIKDLEDRNKIENEKLDCARHKLSDAARDEENLLRQLADDRRRLIQQSSEKEGLEETLRRLETLLDARRQETSLTYERIQKIEDAEAVLVATIADDQKERERLIQDIDIHSEKSREKADLRDEKRDAQIRLSASLDAISEQISSFEMMEQESDHEKLEATVRLTSIDRELASQSEALDRMRRNLEENAIKREQIKIDHSKKEAEYKTLFEERETVTARQQNLLDVYETANERVTTLFAAYEKHRSDMTRLREQNDDLLNRLWETHRLTKDESEVHVVEVDSIRQATIERNTLKKEIDALGLINQNAVADYEALTARLSHMEEQRDDIENATDKLRSIVEELDQSMREQFTKTFHDINENFSQVFSDLFSGGQAELILEGDDDVLEAEIGIRAQPPGKKLQRLSLLSGGERCLTAIALIFAILKLKPTPFCLFDEVESALDDANVDRFSAYVRRYAWKMQFILITHRKGTMAAADRLYGVTMQERGISRVLSMQLSSALSYGD